jgi:outer membrane protein assembly factor BamB
MKKFFQSNAKPVVIAIAAALMIIGTLTLSDALAQVKSSAATDASKPTSVPATKVVGWRGDGTGRYPDATPPTQWYLKENGESKNILWKTKLPCYSWATPIIVGDKIITRSEPYDLICLDKNTGKPLWIRSHPPFVAVTDEEKKANPAFKEIEPLMADLQKVNDAFVKQGWSKELYKQKYDLQKKINDLTAKADEKYEMPKDMWQESWSGYTGETPVSDGKFIYFPSGDGVTACYDLDGKLIWTRYASRAAGWGEHGGAFSPALLGDKLIVGAQALSTKDGKEIWTAKLVPLAHGGTYAAVPFQVGGQDFVAIQNQFIRVSDGKNMYVASVFPGTAPLANGSDVYYIHMTWFATGYHCELAGSDAIKVTQLTSTQLPGPADPSKKWEPMAYYYTASPLYDNGLLYVVSNWGRLSVIDTQKGQVVYTQDKPFDFRNKFSRFTAGCGIGSAPLLAGKYVYLMDNAGCTIVIEPGREYKLVGKNNIDYTITSPWGPNYYDTPHHEVTLATPMVDGNRIYIRGEQFIYCVGEK